MYAVISTGGKQYRVSKGDTIQIEKLDKYEYRAFYSDSEFLNLKIKGGQSEVIKLKPPRNQISIGPVLGITYDSSNGLTSPIWGIGVTYNMVKLWDWR